MRRSYGTAAPTCVGTSIAVAIAVVLTSGVAAAAAAPRFSAPAFTETGHSERVMAADFNGDATPDIAQIDGTCTGLVVLLGTGDANLGKPITSCGHFDYDRRGGNSWCFSEPEVADSPRLAGSPAMSLATPPTQALGLLPSVGSTATASRTPC